MDFGNLGLDFLAPKYGQRTRSRIWKAHDMAFYNVADVVGLMDSFRRAGVPTS